MHQDVPHQVPFKKQTNHSQKNNERLPPLIIQNSSSTVYDDTPKTSTRLTSTIGKHHQVCYPECVSPSTQRNFKSSRVENRQQIDYVNVSMPNDGNYLLSHSQQSPSDIIDEFYTSPQSSLMACEQPMSWGIPANSLPSPLRLNTAEDSSSHLVGN